VRTQRRASTARTVCLSKHNWITRFRCLSPETERNSKMKIPSSMWHKYPVLLVAGLGGLFTVVNLAFAQTWTPTGAPTQAWTFITGRATWASVASSADGIKLVAAGRGRGYPLPDGQRYWCAAWKVRFPGFHFPGAERWLAVIRGCDL